MKTALIAFALAAMLAACTQTAPVAVTDLSNLPAEQALLGGIRLYEDGQYPQAEVEIKRALSLTLRAAKDVANAQKYLAFIYCTSDRIALCESAFRAARTADPTFTLTKSEQGHPLWGPVYAKTMVGKP